MLLHGRANQCRRNRPVLVDRLLQCLLHGILAIPGRQLQNLQIFPGGNAFAVRQQKFIVGHAKMTAGKQVGMIFIHCHGPWLAHQRVNHMPVVDGVLAVSQEPRHGLNLVCSEPNFDFISVNHHVHPHADQPTGNRVGVALDLNRATFLHLDAVNPLTMIELLGRQFTQQLLFLLELCTAACVAFLDQLPQKLLVLLATGKVATAAQQECLIDGRFQVSV